MQQGGHELKNDRFAAETSPTGQKGEKGKEHCRRRHCKAREGNRRTKVLGKGREKIEMRRQLNGHQNPSDDGWHSVAVKARPGNCMQLQNDDWAASR